MSNSLKYEQKQIIHYLHVKDHGKSRIILKNRKGFQLYNQQDWVVKC